MFDYIVIGAGLIGSAAARYVTQHSSNMALIGTAEPEDWSAHKGVFSSHYDEARITRILDKDPVWAELAEKSIAEYKKLELASGIEFHHAVSCLSVGLPGAGSRFDQAVSVAKQMAVEFEQLDASALKEQFPYLQFPAERLGLLEGGAAGYVNPRALVSAQLKVASQKGSWIQEEVQHLSFKPDCVEVHTNEGCYEAARVLVAAGAYSNFLLPEPLAFKVKPQTVLMAELTETEFAVLRDMPSLIVFDRTEPTVFFEHSEAAELAGVYILPPVVYPDGCAYLKIGGHLLDFEPLESKADFLDWFHSEGSDDEIALLKEVLFTVFPNLKPVNLVRKPCAFTITEQERPYIDELMPNRLFVAAGGNGFAAKSSNEIGRLAAQLMIGTEQPKEVFKAVY